MARQLYIGKQPNCVLPSGLHEYKINFKMQVNWRGAKSGTKNPVM